MSGRQHYAERQNNGEHSHSNESFHLYDEAPDFTPHDTASKIIVSCPPELEESLPDAPIDDRSLCSCSPPPCCLGRLRRRPPTHHRSDTAGLDHGRVHRHADPFSASIHEFSVPTPQDTSSATLTDIDRPDPNAATVGRLRPRHLDRRALPGRRRATQHQSSAAVTGTATAAGSLCVRIYDVSDTGLPAPVNYTLTVTHF